MKNQDIINIGKYTFLTFLILGNICLFGYVIFKEDMFALFGYFVLIIGIVVNLLIVLSLVVYGFFNKSQFQTCLNAIGVICINIPIAILYFFIGVSLLNI